MSTRPFKPLAILLLASGCGMSLSNNPLVENVPPIEPTYAEELPPATVPTGGIWQGHSRMMLAEDRRARHPGDLVTILLVERVNAEKSANQQASRSSNTEVSLGDSSLLSWLPDGMLSGGSSSSFGGSGSTKQGNRLSGEMTVTVNRVLPNGALLVSGDRRLSLTRGEEQLQFTGIIRPEDIDGNNRVPSTRVADAKIRYTGTGEISAQARQGWLSRFFSRINPF